MWPATHEAMAIQKMLQKAKNIQKLPGQAPHTQIRLQFSGLAYHAESGLRTQIHGA